MPRHIEAVLEWCSNLGKLSPVCIFKINFFSSRLLGTEWAKCWVEFINPTALQDSKVGQTALFFLFSMPRLFTECHHFNKLQKEHHSHSLTNAPTVTLYLVLINYWSACISNISGTEKCNAFELKWQVSFIIYSCLVWGLSNNVKKKKEDLQTITNISF